MNAVARVLLVPPLAGALLTGCSLAGKPTNCPALDASLELGQVTLTKQDKSYQDSISCEWRAGETTKVKARFYQPTSYESSTRADAATEGSWKKDDEFHVTHRVDGFGDGGYRYTSIVDDEVTVTVKGFRSFRELTVEVSRPYTTEEDLATQEKMTESLAKSLLEAS
ncbi:MAG TPA: hypothetical protein VFC19_51435 [Candidatus Limnocylindrales bacterium]|nr:hypothetical protein [Candidatus Limnocylindrales bacterium]